MASHTAPILDLSQAASDYPGSAAHFNMTYSDDDACWTVASTDHILCASRSDGETLNQDFELSFSEFSSEESCSELRRSRIPNFMQWQECFCVC